MCNFREKKYCRDKECIFFLVFFHQQMKIWKKPWKSHFLGRILFFIQIAYIIHVKGGFVSNAVNTSKKVEKHVIYYFFRKKVYCSNIQCFLFIVWWKQWNKQKFIKNLTFSVKRNFFREIAYIPYFWTKIKMVFHR